MNRSCCNGNYENVTFDLSVKLFQQYSFYLPSFSLWPATFLLPWFGKWHILTNCQNCVQPPLPNTFYWINLHWNKKWKNLNFLKKTTMDLPLWKNANFRPFLNRFFYYFNRTSFCFKTLPNTIYCSILH